MLQIPSGNHPSQPSYRVLNPATGEILETFSMATDAEVHHAIVAADEAFRSWRETPIDERSKVVNRIGELFAERTEELAAIITSEMGKPIDEARDEVAFCVDIFNYFATEGPTLASDQEIKSYSGGRAIIQKRPVGPLLGIMPWNYPYYQVARFAAPNLMLGNTVILKHAESCPRSALAIQKIMDEAGLPHGAYMNVFATHSQVAEIIADPRIQGVSVTGSERAGAAIGELAGKNLKKAVLELGGSDPYVILDADDIDQAAENAWARRMENTGQACNSNKRLIVMADIYEPFVAKLKELAEALRPGNPAMPESGTYAPLSSKAAADGVCALVNDAVDKGATLHAGGHVLDDGSAYFAPAVLTGVTPNMRAYSEEIFGPVAVVYKVASDQEAIELANDSAYGLGGAVFSTDTERARKLAERLDVGMSSVNVHSAERAELPFGGVKRSGFGRELGPLGMDEFVNKRLLYIADQ